MNDRFKMRYLMGGDSVFGPNYGSATVFTDVRAGYLQQCPNIAPAAPQSRLRGRRRECADAGRPRHRRSRRSPRTSWLRAHPDKLHAWLAGVETIDGKPGEAAVLASLKPAAGSGFLTENKIPVGQWMSSLVDDDQGASRRCSISSRWCSARRSTG